MAIPTSFRGLRLWATSRFTNRFSTFAKKKSNPKAKRAMSTLPTRVIALLLVVIPR